MIDYADPNLNRTTADKASAATRGFSTLIAWWFGASFFLPLLGGAITLFLWQGYLGTIGAAVGLVLLVASGITARRLRRRRVRILLNYLLQAVELQLPISEMLKAAAVSETRGNARRVDRLRSALEDGATVGAALSLAVPQTPPRIVDLVNAAERNGCLAPVIKSLVDEPVAPQEIFAIPGFVQAYGLLLVAVVTGVIWTINIFVIPKFAQLFKDFHVLPPASMNFIVSFGDILAPLILIACAAGVLIIAGNAMRQLFSRGLPIEFPFNSLKDWLIWMMPIVGTLARNRGLADALSVAANALDAGRPADQAIREASMPHLNSVLRERVESWAIAIEEGSSLSDSARAAWMPSMVTGLLASGARSGNLPQTMRFLARYYRLRFSRTATLLRAAVVPAITLSVGILVLLTSLGVVEPIARLMQAVEITTHRW